MPSFSGPSHAILALIMFRTALLLSFLGLCAPAVAAETPWQEVAPGVKLRLISADVRQADGSTMLALEVDMPADHKTYWRVPGQSGLPTEIDWQGSTGMTDGQIVWPFPIREEVGGYLDYVYHGPTVLPVRLSLADGPLHVKAAVTMGICSDICVPAMADFTLNVPLDKPDAGNGLRISQAMALTPIPWDGSDTAFGDITFDSNTNGIAVTLDDPAIDPASLLAATDAADIVFGAPQKSPEGAAVFLPILGGDAAEALNGKNIHLTFMTNSGPYDIQFSPDGGVWRPVLH